MKSKRIAGVSVNVKNPPKREELIKLALKTKQFSRDKNAVKNINALIDKSELYPRVSKGAKAKNSKADDREFSRRPDNTEHGDNSNGGKA